MRHLAIAGALALMATPALSQTPRHCASREDVIERLSEKYSETRQAYGLSANNSMMEVFASPASGSWTITVTMPNGITCLIASGEAFEALTEALPPAGEDM